MARMCCVPGCKANYKSQPRSSAISTFTFPKDKILCMKWLIAVKRQNFIPNKHSAVCCRHFDERLIIRTEMFTSKDGSVHTITRGVPKLVDNAVPHIFQANNHSKEVPPKRSSNHTRQLKPDVVPSLCPAFPKFQNQKSKMVLKAEAFLTKETYLKQRPLEKTSVTLNDDSNTRKKLIGYNKSLLYVLNNVGQSLELAEEIKKTYLQTEDEALEQLSKIDNANCSQICNVSLDMVALWKHSEVISALKTVREFLSSNEKSDARHFVALTSLAQLASFSAHHEETMRLFFHQEMKIK